MRVHNMRHYSMPGKRLVAEMRADARDVSLRRKGCAALRTETEEQRKELVAPASTAKVEGTYSSGQALSMRRDFREPQHALADSIT